MELYVRDAVWPSVALKKLVDNRVEVTEEDIQKGFVSNYGPRVEVLAIVLNDHRQAQKVWEMARDNPTDQFFGELAQQYSVDAVSRENFGRVPPIRQFGGRPEMEKEAFAMKPGDLSGIIAAEDNYIILRCTGHTTPVVASLDAEVREELVEDIREKKIRLAMAVEFDRMRESAQIENYLAGTFQSPTKSKPAAASQRPPRDHALPYRPARRGADRQPECDVNDHSPGPGLGSHRGLRRWALTGPVRPADRDPTNGWDCASSRAHRLRRRTPPRSARDSRGTRHRPSAPTGVRASHRQRIRQGAVARIPRRADSIRRHSLAVSGSSMVSRIHAQILGRGVAIVLAGGILLTHGLSRAIQRRYRARSRIARRCLRKSRIAGTGFRPRSGHAGNLVLSGDHGHGSGLAGLRLRRRSGHLPGQLRRSGDERRSTRSRTGPEPAVSPGSRRAFHAT